MVTDIVLEIGLGKLLGLCSDELTNIIGLFNCADVIHFCRVFNLAFPGLQTEINEHYII